MSTILSREVEAAKTLLANIKDIIGDDEQAALDAIEGETNLMEALGEAVSRVQTLEAFQEAIGEQIGKLKARQDRFEAQGERIRTAILVAMADLDLKKLEFANATVTRTTVAPKAQIFNEADIPPRFWKPADPKLDKAAVLAALKNKEVVPGASLSNTSETISIRGA